MSNFAHPDSDPSPGITNNPLKDAPTDTYVNMSITGRIIPAGGVFDEATMNEARNTQEC